MDRFTDRYIHYPVDSPLDKLQQLENKIEDGKFIEVVRCNECAIPHNKWTGCPRLNGVVPPPNFYCGFGEKKVNTVTCIECKHLMFSDCYGECNKSLRIVNPDDTCEYAERKEEKQ